MDVRAAEAYAPATITNFFAVHRQDGATLSLAKSGATGGGYIVSRGVITKATVSPSRVGHSVRAVVDGDSGYAATTTTRAVRLLLEGNRAPACDVLLEQRMQVPVGSGFGASAASALSAVTAVAAALELKLSREAVASYAHDAEILMQTGLGTVSAVYDGTGAGFVYEPGAPGMAKFRNVSVGRDVRIVTAAVAPYVKSKLLSSAEAVARVNKLGGEALSKVEADPTLECMAAAGEWFTKELGLMMPEVRDLTERAKSAGALYASQNMVGHAIHAIVTPEDVDAVVKILASSAARPRVDVLELATKKAGLVQ